MSVDTITYSDDILYSVSARSMNNLLQNLGLMDSGANGGLTDGRTMRLIYWNPNDERISVGGYNGNHCDNNIQLGAFGTVLETTLGPVIGVFFNYGHIPSMRGTIHSKAQVQSFGNSCLQGF